MNPELIKPLSKNVIILPYEGTTKTASGFELAKPDSNQVPVMGTITKVGEYSSFKVGQVVLFRKFASDALKFQTETGEKLVYLVEDGEIKALYQGELPK